MIRIIIGNQGGGKSSYGVKLVMKYLKKGKKVFSNLPIKGCYEFSKDDLMVYDFPSDTVLIFDEGATYGLGSRGNMYKKNTTDELVEFFTMHRHYSIEDVIIISPNFNDILPCVRDNATEIILVKNGILGLLFGLNSIKKIKREYVIDEISHKIDYGYYWKPFSTRWFNRKSTYKYYDSWVKKELTYKDWQLYNTFEDDIKSSFKTRLKEYLLSKKTKVNLPKIKKK